MEGWALSTATNTLLTISTDPTVVVLTDATGSSAHMTVSIIAPAETEFSMSQFAQVGGHATKLSSSEPIAVGPNAYGSTIGDAWVLGKTANADGNYPIYRWENAAWVKQPGAGTQIAVSPSGNLWVLNSAGDIHYWSGSKFVRVPGCATWIAVGPNAYGSTYGDPWVIGCGSTGNNSIFQLQGSTWVQQPGAATRIAVEPVTGVPWVINDDGNIYVWFGSQFVNVSNGLCATDIAVGPITAPFATSLGTPWVIGCGSTGDNAIYQWQGSWVQIPGAATKIAVSPNLGVPWVVNADGNIYE